MMEKYINAIFLIKKSFFEKKNHFVNVETEPWAAHICFGSVQSLNFLGGDGPIKDAPITRRKKMNFGGPNDQ
jgi:hypothetical protein